MLFLEIQDEVVKMRKRPVCCVCLVLILVLFVLDRAGYKGIRGNPFSDSEKEWIREQKMHTIAGKVVSCTRNDTSQRILLEDVYLIKQDQRLFLNHVLVYTKEKREVSAGTSLLICGKLEEPEQERNPGGFDQKTYYACRHIYYFCKEAEFLECTENRKSFRYNLEKVRNVLKDTLEKCAGEDAPFFEAMLLGDKSELDERFQILAGQAGILHVLTISGMHMGVLGSGILEILLRLGCSLRTSGSCSFVFMLLYTLLTGSGMSAVRAMVMYILAVGGKIMGRSYDSLTALSLTAILLLLECPAWLFSGSFLLSFSAVLGITAVSPVLKRNLECRKKPLQHLISVVGIQITMLPALLNVQGEISLAGIVLNLLVVPSVSVVLISGLSAVILGWCQNEIGICLAFPGRVLIHIYEWLSELVSRSPFCVWIAGKPGIEKTLCYGAGILLLLLGLTRVKKISTKRLLVLIMCILPAFLAQTPEHDLSITCLDVGQGDCCVIHTPEHRYYVIDCGSSSEKQTGRYTLIPYLKAEGISFIDAVFISHTDEDHVSGIMELLTYIEKNYVGIRIGQLLLPEVNEKNGQYEMLETQAARLGIKVQKAAAGDSIQAGKMKWNILWPKREAEGEDINENAMVLEVIYGKFRGLFTGDIGIETEEKLLCDWKTVDFLKTAHHGSAYSTGENFLKRTLPKIAVISCAERNRYGHPAKETIERMEQFGCSIFYTMHAGSIRVKTDGESVMVQEYMKSGFSGKLNF